MTWYSTLSRILGHFDMDLVKSPLLTQYLFISLVSLSLPVTLSLGTKKSVLSWPTLISPTVTEDKECSGILSWQEKIMHFCLQRTLPFSQSMDQKLLILHKTRQMNLSATWKKDIFSKVFVNSSLSEYLHMCLVLAMIIER